jgi:GH43 family beta-xylosidase
MSDPKKSRARWLTIAACGLLAACATAAPQTFTNPLLPSGPDPWVTEHEGVFYYMHTSGDRLEMRKTRDMARLADASPTVIWRPPATGPNAISIWAPELHRIDGKWYVYYTAAASGQDNDAHRGVFVLENGAEDPTTGTWVDRGQVNTRYSGIDGTTFVYEGKRYFVYSPYVGPDSVLAIARMANPWTIEGEEAIIARPEHAWEKQGGRQILEGPEFLLGPDGDLFLSYSASACWSDDYALGLLSAPAGSDPLDPAAWTKSPEPVFRKSPANGVYAPGHNGFFTAADGREHWIIYHANPGPDMQCTSKRSPRIQRFEWDGEGAPVFGEPVAGDTPLAPPGARE